jgi:hypothetical protein
MGAGRKTSTSSYDSANSPGGGRVPIPPDRNLGEELGGVIFGATAATMKGALRVVLRVRTCVCVCVCVCERNALCRCCGNATGFCAAAKG